MRLDFNVLWVEDQPERVKAQINRIAISMAREGFELVPRICTNLDEVVSHLSDDLFADEIDLILVDWELGGALRGQQVISRIRESIRYKDIIFYSAATDVRALREAAHTESLEGVYFVRRTDLVDEIVGVFESLVKKVLDLDHTRGIVMGATSDVDDMTRKCLHQAHDLLGEDERAGILDEMLSLLDDKVLNVKERVQKTRSDPSINDLLDAKSILTANDNLRILTRLLGMNEFGSHKEYRQHVSAYTQEIVPKRNILGHQVLSPAGKPIAIASTDGNQLSSSDMKRLRVRLLELRGHFRDLLQALSR